MGPEMADNKLLELLQEDPNYSYGHGLISSLLPARWPHQEGEKRGQGELGDFFRALASGQAEWAVPNILREAGNALVSLGNTQYGQDISPQAKNLLMALPMAGLPMARQAAKEGSTVLGTFTGYHGGGKAFDKFDDQFIGTGEGAQVYGHGHYIAGRPGTAKKYYEDRARDNLGTELLFDKKPYYTPTGQIANKFTTDIDPKLSPEAAQYIDYAMENFTGNSRFHPADEIRGFLHDVYTGNLNDPHVNTKALHEAMDWVGSNSDRFSAKGKGGLSYPDATNEQQQILGEIETMLKYRQPNERMTPQSLLQKKLDAAQEDYNTWMEREKEMLRQDAGHQSELPYYPSATAMRKKKEQELNLIKSVDPTKLKYDPPAHFYEVKVLPEEEDFLHWDKPLSEQSPQVFEKLKTLLEGPNYGYVMDPVRAAKVQEADKLLDTIVGYTGYANVNKLREMRDSGNWVNFPVAKGEQPFDIWTQPLIDKASRYVDLWDEISGWGNASQYLSPTKTGEDLYRLIHYDDPREASRLLKEAGIPGIRYFDQMSRDTHIHGGVTFAGQNLSGSNTMPNTKWNVISKIANKDPDTEAAIDSAVSLLHKYGNVDATLRALEDAAASIKAGRPEFANNPNLQKNLWKENQRTLNWIKQNKDKIGFAPEAKQTHNYVVFDPQHIQILSRNGEPLVATPFEGNPFE